MGCSSEPQVLDDDDVKQGEMKINRKKKIDYKNKKEFIEIMLEKHNEYRKIHGSSKLEQNENLNKMAQEFAKKLLLNQNSQIFSSYVYNGEPLGENIYISNKLKPEKIVEKWYKGNEGYDYNSNKFQKGKEHFTQIVWKNTKEVGFGYESEDDKICIVVYYFPAGNIFGEFTKNVLKPNNNKNN